MMVSANISKSKTSPCEKWKNSTIYSRILNLGFIIRSNHSEEPKAEAAPKVEEPEVEPAPRPKPKTSLYEGLKDNPVCEWVLNQGWTSQSNHGREPEEHGDSIIKGE